MTATPRLLSQSAYAKHRDCTHGAVQKAIKSGRLLRALVTCDDGKVRIDPEVADVEWQANTSQVMQRKEPAAPATPKRGAGTAAHEPPVTAAAGGDDTLSLNESRARRAHFEAQMAELDYREKAGQLIDASVARHAITTYVAQAKKNLQVLPDRLAAVVLSAKNDFEARQLIEKEVRNVLQELSTLPLQAGAKGPNAV